MPLLDPLSQSGNKQQVGHILAELICTREVEFNLGESVRKLIDAEGKKDERKKRWLSLLQQGDEQQHGAKEDFLAADEAFYAAGQELSGMLTDLSSMQVLDLAIGLLDDELTLAFHRLVDTLKMRHLVEENGQNMSFGDLVRAVRSAGRTLDAAVRINELCLANEPDEFERLLETGTAWRDEAAWQSAVCAFRFILANCQVAAGDAAHMCFRRLQRLHGKLMQQLQLEVEERIARGTFGSSLAEMELDVARYLRNLVESGLARQVQLSSAPEPSRRRLAVLGETDREQ